MKRNDGQNGRKNKYFIPTVIISVLLVVVLSLLLFVIFEDKNDLSVSKDNVIGNVTASDASNLSPDNRFDGALSARFTPLKVIQESAHFKISWLTGNDAEVSFSVANMYPGDSITKECKLTVNTWKAKAITFTKNIVDGTNNQKLAEILMLKVEFDGVEYYNGLLRDMDKVVYQFSEKLEVLCNITLTMPGGREIDNSYSLLSLTTDFTWTLTEEMPLPPEGGEVVTPETPGSAAKLTDSTLLGKKVIEGREWNENDSFTFVLEYKFEDSEYKKLAEKTVTSPDDTIDFSEEISNLSLGHKALYTFRITEVAGDSEGLKYDSSEKIFQVLVGDVPEDSVFDILSVAGDGVAVAKKTATAYDMTFEFKNVYSSEPIDEPADLEVKLPIKNDVELGGSDGDGEGGIDDETDLDAVKDKTFVFVIENVETGEKQMVSLGGGEDGEFELTYTADDVGKTFKYKVYAFNDGQDDVAYSDKVYELVVEVLLDPETNEIYTKMTLDGVDTTPEDIIFKFDTDVKIDTIVHLLKFPIIIIILEIAWLWFIFYKRKKQKMIDEAASTVKLGSWMTPVPFFSLLVAKWEVVVFVALTCISVAMLVCDIICQIKFYPYKSRKTNENESENKKEEADSDG